MPIYATNDARNFWENSLKSATRARSLAAAKFVVIAESENDKTWRSNTCEAIRNGATLAAKSASIAQFTGTLAGQGAILLHAKLEARLIINAGGGVIENGGICLDRTSGIPFIPGSAVKGCARRHAITVLSEEKNLETKATLLAQIALIFGFGDQEWKPGRLSGKDSSDTGSARSDFWLAMVPLFDSGSEYDDKRDELWATVSENAARLIFKHLGRIPEKPDLPAAPQLPNLGGSISFLPAYPDRDCGIEIDVLTPHHAKYYDGKKSIATDDEDPTPILFPTIAPGATFCFALLPLRPGGKGNCEALFTSSALELTRLWLAEALQLFGLGAKTNAGYGWFEIDSTAEKKAAEARAAKQEADMNAARLASLSPEEQATERIQSLNDEEFATFAKSIATHPEPEQRAFFTIILGPKKKVRKRWKDNKPDIWKALCDTAATLDITLP